MSLPTWSHPSRPTLGRDPLGIQATSVRVYRELVPGLTNVTNRLRYYSYYCWVVRQYERARHADDEAQWRIWVRRAEALYALASEIENPEETGGLAGGDWARAYLKEHREGRIELRRYTDKPGQPNANQYLLARRGNFGQFYVRSMTEVGFLQPTTGVPLVSRPRGEELAAAFGAAVGDRVEGMIANALADGSVEYRNAKAIGTAVHPASIHGASREMRLLRDFVLGNVPDVVDGSARRASAWLLLDLLRRGVSLDDETAIRRAFYYRVLPGGARYQQPGQVIDRWRIYQANELCHIALEVWLNAVAIRIGEHSDGVSPRQVISDLLDSAFSARDLRGDWDDWAADMGKMSVGEEGELSQSVLEVLRDLERAQDRTALQAALRLLAALYVRWRNGEGGVRSGLAEYAGVGGRSLSQVLASLERSERADARETVRSVLQEHVVESHLAIAARKLAATDKFTYRFTLSDGVLSDGVSTNYGYTNPRLRNLARFLRDAKLCADDALTAAGEKFLDDNQPS